MRRSFMLFLGSLALITAVWLGLRAGDSTSVEGALPVNRQTGGGTLPVPLSEVPEPGGIEGDAPVIPNAQPSLNTTTKAMTSESPPSGPELIEQWLSSSTDIPTIVRAVLDGFPKLAPSDHLLAASRVAPMIGDGETDGLKRLLLDSKTSAEAKEYLFRDAINRAAEAKWPIMFAIMTTPNHPHAQEAHDALVSDLGTDYGANQGQWLARIHATLKEQ